MMRHTAFSATMLATLLLAAPARVQAQHDHHAQAVSTPAAPACTPEHAAMGHCTLDDAPAAKRGAVGTDLPAGDGIAPPPPADWAADAFFPKAEMERSRHAMMVENGGQKIGALIFNLAEYQFRKGRDGYRWDAEGWYGGDINRLVVTSEGEGGFGHGAYTAEFQLLYSRAIDPYFNLRAGLRQDIGEDPNRTYATIGVEGLAPYWVETEAALFVSNKGDMLAHIELSHDQRLTQRLILHPSVEASFAAQDIPDQAIGSGLGTIELGLRLRYEPTRKFAPYIGVEWSRNFGDTARFSTLKGDGRTRKNLLFGLRAWF